MRTAGIVAVAFIVACTSTTSFSYVPWIPLPRGNQYALPPPPSPPVTIPPGTALCVAGQLEGELIGAFQDQNDTDTPVALRNSGSAPCYLNGFPDVAIVDAKGGVLAQIVGEDAMLTAFDRATAAVAVMMPPGTPPLTSVTDFNLGQGLRQGQAFVNIEWSNCNQPPAAMLYLDLPDGAGRVAVPYVVAPGMNCRNTVPLARGPLNPAGIVWPPPPPYIHLETRMSHVPSSVKRGSTLTFYLTIRNVSVQDYVLTPCPDYSEALVPNLTVVYYQLNCAPVGAIRPGEAVTFEMKFDIPQATPTGATSLLFGLVDGRVSPPSVLKPITIT